MVSAGVSRRAWPRFAVALCVRRDASVALNAFNVRRDAVRCKGCACVLGEKGGGKGVERKAELGGVYGKPDGSHDGGGGSSGS